MIDKVIIDNFDHAIIHSARFLVLDVVLNNELFIIYLSVLKHSVF